MVTLTGNGGLTKDPELRHTGTGEAVATVSVACSRRDRDADPVYVELVLWETQAELASIVEASLKISGEVCIYSNTNVKVETL